MQVFRLCPKGGREVFEVGVKTTIHYGQRRGFPLTWKVMHVKLKADTLSAMNVKGLKRPCYGNF